MPALRDPEWEETAAPQNAPQNDVDEILAEANRRADEDLREALRLSLEQHSTAEASDDFAAEMASAAATLADSCASDARSAFDERRGAGRPHARRSGLAGHWAAGCSMRAASSLRAPPSAQHSR